MEEWLPSRLKGEGDNVRPPTKLHLVSLCRTMWFGIYILHHLPTFVSLNNFSEFSERFHFRTQYAPTCQHIVLYNRNYMHGCRYMSSIATPNIPSQTKCHHAVGNTISLDFHVLDLCFYSDIYYRINPWI